MSDPSGSNHPHCHPQRFRAATVRERLPCRPSNRSLTVAALLLLIAAVCQAADWSTLYTPAKLKAEQPRLQTAIDFLIQKEIQPFIPAEQATAFGLQTIDLPLDGFRSDPLDVYAENGHIILPVRTLLFLEDLSRCYGWLWTNRMSTKTVDEYLGMLRYRSASDFPDHQYPDPLKALHIPENALSDPKVVDSAVQLRRTADSFLLLHQFAHLQLHHQPAANHSFSDAQEEEADAYALNIMKENSVTPTGIFLVMYSGMFFESGAGTALHPVTASRMLAMAHFMDERVFEFIRGRPDKATAMDGIHSIASLLVEGAEWLTIGSHRQDLQHLALKTDPATLQPRPLPKTTK